MQLESAPAEGGRDSPKAAVFLNLPYDASSVDLFLAYIAGLASLGLVPRATLEIAGGERRLDRTLQLLTECPYSVHELSPVATAGNKPVRLNMAFEPGLTVAMDRASKEKHTWFVFEARRSRLDRSLSDLAGTDAYFHGARPAGVFRELSNAFVRREHQTSVQEMQRVFHELRRALPVIVHKAGARSPFTARVFNDLCALAGAITKIVEAASRK